jgi:hypothetical protein
LWASREALHRNEIFAAGNAKVYAHERNFHDPGEPLRQSFLAAPAVQRILPLQEKGHVARLN